MKENEQRLSDPASRERRCGHLQAMIHRTTIGTGLNKRIPILYIAIPTYWRNMTRYSWGNRPWQSNAYQDVKDDLNEKDATERELARRNALPQTE
jgi:hypothetical protein